MPATYFGSAWRWLSLAPFGNQCFGSVIELLIQDLPHDATVVRYPLVNLIALLARHSASPSDRRSAPSPSDRGSAFDPKSCSGKSSARKPTGPRSQSRCIGVLLSPSADIVALFAHMHSRRGFRSIMRADQYVACAWLRTHVPCRRRKSQCCLTRFPRCAGRLCADPPRLRPGPTREQRKETTAKAALSWRKSAPTEPASWRDESRMAERRLQGVDAPRSYRTLYRSPR
jgi:hypothetical protein